MHEADQARGYGSIEIDIYCMIVLGFEVLKVELKLGNYKQLGGPN